MKRKKRKINLLTPAAKKRIMTFEKEAERIISQLAAKRDELRELISTYNDILDSLDCGVEDCENYLTNFEHAIDQMSEQI